MQSICRYDEERNKAEDMEWLEHVLIAVESRDGVEGFSGKLTNICVIYIVEWSVIITCCELGLTMRNCLVSKEALEIKQ